MKLLKLLLIFNLFSTFAWAQFGSTNKRAADLYFKNKEYYAAAAYYKKALQISPDSTGFVMPYGFGNRAKKSGQKYEEEEYCVYQLATSLRLYQDYHNAEAWYALASKFSDPRYAQSGFYYGECLRANQKYEDAITAYQTFIQDRKPEGVELYQAKTGIASCNFALYEMRYPQLYKFSKLASQVNGKGSNYTPVLNRGSFYFSSSRPVEVNSKTEILEDTRTNAKVTKKQNPFLNAIYAASGDPRESAAAVRRLGALEKGKEYAAPAFHPDGKVMYLTSWTEKGNKKICAVDISAGTGASWAAPKELGPEVNVIGFNSLQPFVTSDGRYLIFASDRPGGLGKYDLWYCILRQDGTLGQAVNLGKTINSPENEEAPYYNSRTKKLLYSSAGRIGLGGLDFYESEGDFTSWTTPRNLGYPFNSSKDDVYFTPLKDDDSEGYISSDRASVCCLEIFLMKKEFIAVEGTLTDCQDGKPLAEAVVTLRDSTGEQKMTTGMDGKYSFKISSGRALSLTMEKTDYFKKSVRYTYEQLAHADTLLSQKLCMAPYKVNTPIVLKDILFAYKSASLNPDSKAILDQLYVLLTDNPQMRIELSAHTDNIGGKDYNQKLSERRAQSCVSYLISKGVSPGRLTARGYGYSKPVAPNRFPSGEDNFLGRQMNRRTEFTVVSP